jgi:hypothetical protein
MVLARIITRSHQCSRELALDLLARGYSVEIVSPDKIPDNIADLELRVDAGPGDCLTATVAAHDGERSASLEFVHYLKAPMGDFIRRPPESPEVVRIPEPTTTTCLNAKPRIKNVGLPVDVPQPAQKIVSPAAALPLTCKLDPEDAGRLTVAEDPLPIPPVEPPGYFAVEDSPVARPTAFRPVQSLPRRDRSAAWRWRTALMFAGVVLLAAVLGFGMRRTGKAAAQRSRPAPVGKVAAASTGMTPGAAALEKDTVKGPRQVSALASSPSAVKSEGNSGHAPKSVPVAKAAPVTKAATATATHPVRASRTHSDDLIARNTVTYLDKRFEPRPVKKSASKVKTAKNPARQRPGLRKHGGVIAANELTYLHKPSPKAAK